MFFSPSRRLAARRLERGGPRIYDPRERVLLGAFDLGLRAASRLARLRPRAPFPDVSRAERILALRLDRLGDLLMTLPALRFLRRTAPAARIELAVGSWNEPIARSLPFVDAVRVVDAPWAAWGDEADTLSAARRKMAAAEAELAIEFQGDVRALLLAALSGAPLRAGYGDTGGSYLLTHRGRWDETRSWYWQNAELVRTVFPGAGEDPAACAPYNFLDDGDRDEARRLLRTCGLDAAPRPHVGIQPSAGRSLKEWEPEKFAALADRLAARGTVVLTGAASDAALVERIVSRAATAPRRLLGAPLRAFGAVIESLDVFVTGDTGPMHLAHAVGTPNVAIFGPSDPVRYGPDDVALRRVVRQPVYCSPCNMIRRPPKECARAASPECIAGITLEQVLAAVTDALGSG